MWLRTKMSKRKHNKKASDDQKEYLLAYMEQNKEFAQNRFKPLEGTPSKASKWQMLTTKLNRIGGATKDVNQWRKYWRDQKLRAYEREALIKASLQISGENVDRSFKRLNPFEERLLAVVAPATVTRHAQKKKKPPPEKQPEEASESSKSPSFSKELEDSSFGKQLEESSFGKQREEFYFGKQPEESYFEERRLKIEEEKLVYIKKTYELQEKTLNWKMEYEGRLLELREREIFLREKEFELQLKKDT